MSEYTPSIERVINLYSWALRWDTGPHDDRPDLAKLQEEQRGEIQRALATFKRETEIALLERLGKKYSNLARGESEPMIKIQMSNTSSSLFVEANELREGQGDDES